MDSRYYTKRVALAEDQHISFIFLAPWRNQGPRTAAHSHLALEAQVSSRGGCLLLFLSSYRKSGDRLGV